jgi:RNA polymerase sigma factor (sigma-70 family)
MSEPGASGSAGRELDWLAGRFEENRDRLRGVAYRMLGSAAEADDAVQETWLRVSRAGAGEVGNLAGWLTTITARVCLTMLQARRSRREEPAGARPPEPAGRRDGDGPEDQAVLADSVGLALLAVLDTLSPAERVALVLHDMFAVTFEEIAPILDRSPAAARQLASRARRRVQGTAPDAAADRARQRTVVAAFLAASRRGDFAALLRLLDPDVVLRADRAAVRLGAPGRLRGARDVAGTFCGRARAARLALIDGLAGLAWAPGGRPRVVFTFTISGGTIAAIDMTADPGRLRRLDVAITGG